MLTMLAQLGDAMQLQLHGSLAQIGSTQLCTQYGTCRQPANSNVTASATQLLRDEDQRETAR